MTLRRMPANRTQERVLAIVDAGNSVLQFAAPAVDLVVRLALAGAFFAPGMLPAIHSAEGPGAAWLAVVVRVAGPALLAVGLWTRPVSLLILGLTLLTRSSGPPQDTHLFWAALFGWYLAKGAGPLSLDHVLGKGLGLSPLPFASGAMALSEWSARHVAPLYQLAIRLWLAAALVVATAAPAMLPADIAGTLPPGWAVPLAVLLALGLATPAAGLIGIITGLGPVMMHHDAAMAVYGPLLLALLTASGAGRYSLDAMIGYRLRRQAPVPDDAPHVVIVGAGFGGMACAAGLRHEQVRVTLIDRQNYHLFQPLLYQVATGSLSPADIATPIRGLFVDDTRLRVLCGSVSAIDTDARCVTVSGRRIGYDALVLATGASHGYFGHEEWAQFAPGLKSIEDATSMRSRILNAFEEAEATDDAAARSRLLTFLICGAGPTGVELAGAIAGLARHGMAKEFRTFDPASARVVLVQSGPRVLPQFPERLSAFAQASLKELGVEVRLDSRVEAIDAEGVIVGGERIFAATVLWAAGVVASPAAAWLGKEPDKSGRLKVKPDLSVLGLPEVFAVGDTALALAWNGKPVPGLASAAKQGGSYVAAVLRAQLHGAHPPPPFSYRHQGSLATIGRKSAVADFGTVKLTGAVAWWLWGAVHILLLAGIRNRLWVAIGWMWSYFTIKVGVRLITQAGSRVMTRGPSNSGPAYPQRTSPGRTEG